MEIRLVLQTGELLHILLSDDKHQAERQIYSSMILNSFRVHKNHLYAVLMMTDYLHNILMEKQSSTNMI